MRRDVDGNGPPVVREVPLTSQLARSSRKIHNISNTLVVAKLAVVCTEQELYYRALACFYHVHKAIEDALEHCSHLPAIAALLHGTRPAAWRSSAFLKDLLWFQGQVKSPNVPAPSPEVLAYQVRLEHIRVEDPVRLIAHAFTQQMAMLAGGQRVAQYVGTQLGLKLDGPGLAAFRFEESGEDVAGKLSDAYRTVMNKDVKELLTPEDVDKLLDEHMRVFEMNNAIIAAFPVTTWQTLYVVARQLWGLPRVRYVTLAITGSLAIWAAVLLATPRSKTS